MGHVRCSAARVLNGNTLYYQSLEASSLQNVYRSLLERYVIVEVARKVAAATAGR
jgi:hypothetical protein